MSRRNLRCRNPSCPVSHGALLGQVTSDGGLVLNPSVRAFAVYVDTKRVIVACPQCSARREFHGTALFSPHCWGQSNDEDHSRRPRTVQLRFQPECPTTRRSMRR